MMKTLKMHLGSSVIVSIIIVSIIGCKKESNEIENAPNIPILITYPVDYVTQHSAICGGLVTYDGGSAVNARGLCWDTIKTPTINSFKSIDDNGLGNFSRVISGLKDGTRYYICAYATNVNGTGYGNIIWFTTRKVVIYGKMTDNEGNEYRTITLGTQVWMADNLRSVRYRNGDLIATTADTLDISAEINPKYQWGFNNDEDYIKKNGRMYTWYAATDSRVLAPEGWHIPTDAEWTELTQYLIDNGYGFQGIDDYIAKSMASTEAWFDNPFQPEGVGFQPELNNNSGFSALPSRYRSSEHPGSEGMDTYWWCSTESSEDRAWTRKLSWTGNQVYRHELLKRDGLSIRCVKD